MFLSRFLIWPQNTILHFISYQQSPPRSSWQSTLGLKKDEEDDSRLPSNAAWTKTKRSNAVFFYHQQLLSSWAPPMKYYLNTKWLLFHPLLSLLVLKCVHDDICSCSSTVFVLVAALCVGRRLLCSQGTVKLCDQRKVNLTHITGTSIVTHQNRLILTTFLSLKGHRVQAVCVCVCVCVCVSVCVCVCVSVCVCVCVRGGWM